MTTELIEATPALPQVQAPEVAAPAEPRRLPPVPWRDPHSVSPELLTGHIRDLEAACEREPQNVGLRTCLGMAYAMNYQVYKSMDALELAVSQDPAYFYSQMKYAELHYRLRALIKAETETVRALELAESQWEYAMARRQLQEIRSLMRLGTQKPEWKKSLRRPVAMLLAICTFMAVMVYFK